MVEFVRSRGRVRYDVYAKEHSFGPDGFYSKQLDIREKNSGVVTPTTKNIMYKKALVALLLVIGSSYVRENTPQFLGGRSLTFCEIGGGDGQFKQEFVEAWAQYGRNSGMPELEYTSVDINPNHLGHQRQFGGDVFTGTATATTLPNYSVDILFNEELLDCSPFRLLGWNAQSQKIEREGYVSLENGALVLSHELIQEPDNAISRLNKHLSTLNYRYPFYKLAIDHEDYLLEAKRILKPNGMLVSSDYTSEGLGSIGKLTSNPNADEHRSLESPYQVDLTHGVDFDRLVPIADNKGIKTLYHKRLAEAFSDWLPLSFLPAPAMNEAFRGASFREILIGKRRET